MADIRISGLLEKTTLGSSDQFAIYDTLGGLDKKVTAANVAVYVLQNSNQNISIENAGPTITLTKTDTGNVEKVSVSYLQRASGFGQGIVAADDVWMPSEVYGVDNGPVRIGTEYAIAGEDATTAQRIFIYDGWKGNLVASFAPAISSNTLITTDGTNLIQKTGNNTVGIHAGTTPTINTALNFSGAGIGTISGTLTCDGTNLYFVDGSNNTYNVSNGFSNTIQTSQPIAFNRGVSLAGTGANRGAIFGDYFIGTGEDGQGFEVVDKFDINGYVALIPGVAVRAFNFTIDTARNKLVYTREGRADLVSSGATFIACDLDTFDF
jgi:hypothetical protein